MNSPVNGGLEYADCIPCRGVRHSSHRERMSWWWDSTSGALWNVEDPFIAITLTWNGNTNSGPIFQSIELLVLVGIFETIQLGINFLYWIEVLDIL